MKEGVLGASWLLASVLFHLDQAGHLQNRPGGLIGKEEVARLEPGVLQT